MLALITTAFISGIGGFLFGLGWGSKAKDRIAEDDMDDPYSEVYCPNELRAKL